MRGLTEYTQFLRSNAQESEALYQDILIGVTSFFRDPEAFEMLKSRILPALFTDRSRHDPLRAWVLGCASGEESYSVAIALKEYAAEIGSQVPIVVYATDLNNAASRSPVRAFTRTASSRTCRPKDCGSSSWRRTVATVSPSPFGISAFARQNVLTDPPFSRMDLISCRNVLIYLEPHHKPPRRVSQGGACSWWTTVQTLRQ